MDFAQARGAGGSNGTTTTTVTTTVSGDSNSDSDAFASLDTDGNGQLSKAEFDAAKPHGAGGHFIAMAFLIAGKLSHLPPNPLQKARACP